MATTKSSRRSSKSKTMARRATASAHRHPPGATRRSKASRPKSARAAANSENPPLAPELRTTLAQLKKRGEAIVSQLTASLVSKKKASPKQVSKRAAAPRKSARTSSKAK